MNNLIVKQESKIFDPRDASTSAIGCELTDPTVARRSDGWWMAMAGQPSGHGSTDLFSAILWPQEQLSASGWQPVRDATGALVPLSLRNRSEIWDGKGGRHCPSYVKGWDPERGAWVERIYYAGSSENLWGPYTIGFLEWNGVCWQDQSQPAFFANEEWEHGSVYEPNLVFHDGKWRMWYVAGSNFEDYLVHGYSESKDGRTGWSAHKVFAGPEMKMFDFCVRQRGLGFDAIYSRIWMGRGQMRTETGLWWCRSTSPSGTLSDWGDPVQIMTAADRGWHSGPWKPSFQFEDRNGNRALVFFAGSYRNDEAGPFPFVLTMGCAEIELPD